MMHTKARQDTARVLRDLLELWESGARLSASVVLQTDGTGRFAIQIEDSGAEADADTLPDTPRAIAQACDCRQEGCPVCDRRRRRKKRCPIALHADDCDCGGSGGDR